MENIRKLKRRGQEMKIDKNTDLRKVGIDIWNVVPYYFNLTEDQKQITRYRVLSNIYLQFKMDVDDVAEILPPHKNPFDDPDFIEVVLERMEDAEWFEDFELCQILNDVLDDYSRQMD